jgi:hypothetical protein
MEWHSRGFRSERRRFVWPVREWKVSCLTTQRSEPLKVDRTAASSCDVAIIIRVGLTDRRWAKQTDGKRMTTT